MRTQRQARAASSAPDTPVEEIFAHRVEFEHQLIANRMTWLMTLNRFLVAGGAVLVANQDKFNDSSALSGALLAISTLGLTGNASCYFSNYWGVRGIRAAGEALDRAWLNMHLSPIKREERRLAMSLYGRGPRAFGLPYKPPPSQVLHPWFLLPLAFVLLFGTVPYLAGAVSRRDVDLSGAIRNIQLAPLVLFSVLIALDWRYQFHRDVKRTRLMSDNPLGVKDTDPHKSAVKKYKALRDEREHALGGTSTRRLRVWRILPQSPHVV